MHLSYSGLNLRDTIRQEVDTAGVRSDAFDELSSKMADAIVKSKSKNTNDKYFHYFKKWESFIKANGGSALPASPIHIALYLTDLIDKQYSYSVISASVYSIKWAHSLKNLPDPTNNMFVTNLLESAKRTQSRSANKKEPVSSEMLISLCLKYRESVDILIVRDLCMILVGYCAFLRYDEISSLHCNDIAFFDNHLRVYNHQKEQNRSI